MEVHLKPETEAKLRALAEQTHRPADQLLADAADRLLDYDNWFTEQVQLGLDAIKAGRTIPDEEVLAWVDEWERE